MVPAVFAQDVAFTQAPRNRQLFPRDANDAAPAVCSGEVSDPGHAAVERRTGYPPCRKRSVRLALSPHTRRFCRTPPVSLERRDRDRGLPEQHDLVRQIQLPDCRARLAPRTRRV
jgi:hypothetical protein